MRRSYFLLAVFFSLLFCGQTPPEPLADLATKKDWPVWEKTFETLSDSLIDAKKYDEALDFSQKSLAVLAKLGRSETETAAIVLNQTAYAYRKKEDFSAALSCFRQAIRLFEKLGTKGKAPAWANNTAAKICLRKLDYQAAFNYFETVSRVDTGRVYRASALLNEGLAHLLLKNIDTAQKRFETGLAEHPSPYYEAFFRLHLADCFLEMGQNAAAQKNAQAALHFFEKEAEHEAALAAQITLGSIAEKMGQNQVAEMRFQKALDVCQKAFGSSKNREAAKLLVRFADFLAKINQKDRAIAQYQKAIVQIFSNFSSLDPLQNPPAEAAYAESFGMTAPARKAVLLLEKGKKAADPAEKRRFLEAAASAFDLAFGCIQQLREGYGDEAAKLYLGDYAHDYLEKALETQWLRSITDSGLRITDSGTASEKSVIRNPESVFFRLLEANRAVVLGEAIRKNRSFSALGLPDSLRDREAETRRVLADLHGQKMSAATDSARAVLAEKIAATERDRRLFLEKMDSEWPELRRLREAPALPSLAEMQAKLGPDAAFLSFFEGSDGLFIFALEAGKRPSIRRFSLDSIKNDLAEFTGFFAEKSRIDAAPARFFELSNRLFKKLVPLEKLPKRLVVAPDGAVGFVPFDALLTEKWGQKVVGEDAKNGQSGFSNAPFLVKKTAIEQAWSAAIWASPNSKNAASGGSRLQHFLPVFERGERGLSPLLFSQNETEKADFETVSGQNASATAFFEKTKKPLAALHLSTHATASGHQPRLEFFDRSATFAELYGATISADLVVLSACETGIGKHEKSEGLLSLARAFAYAGARSLVASLWSVNERSTAQLFSLFYENLDAKKSTPSEALRSAKLAFLANETALDAQKSPYFWAGFVPTGEQFPMKKTAARWPFGLLLAGAATGVFAFFKRRKKPK